MLTLRDLWGRPCAAGLLFVLGLVAFLSPIGGNAGTSVRGAGSQRVETGLPAALAAASKAERAKVPRVEKPRAVRSARAAATTGGRDDRLSMFRGLGAWIDLYDLELDPRATVALMRRYGVRTLYIQTARYNTRYAIHPRVHSWLVYAHRAGMKVVGWYLPAYANLRHDLNRTVAVARYQRHGHRFDAVGVDIEFRSAVRSVSRWNQRMARHLQLVRRALGPKYPVASIPPPPLQMQVAPMFWAGFPWRSLARYTDAIMLMSYWSDRRGCPKIRLHCAYEFTAGNVALTRALIGNRDIPIHVIGGVGDSISGGELLGFVQAARDIKADGASIYDVATTRSSWWRVLARLRELGDDRSSR